MSQTQPTSVSAPISGWAIASLVLGVLSFGLSIVAGLPAMFLGLRSLRTINESGDRLRGRPAAIAGMALGACTTLITIVGLVCLGLLQLQNTANRVSCANNLRQLGMAIQGYEMQAKHYPYGTVSNDRLQPQQRLSWLVTLLPYTMPDAGPQKQALPQKGILDQIDRESAWDSPANLKAVETPLRFVVCPALLGARSRQGPAVTTYPGMAGVGRDAASLPREQNGVLTPHIGVFGYDRAVGPDDLARGLSYTILLTETARDNGPWVAGGPPTVRPVDAADQPYLGFGRAFGGLHGGGLNVLLADGSVRFYRDNLDPRQWETMATIADQP